MGEEPEEGRALLLELNECQRAEVYVNVAECLQGEARSEAKKQGRPWNKQFFMLYQKFYTVLHRQWELLKT